MRHPKTPVKTGRIFLRILILALVLAFLPHLLVFATSNGRVKSPQDTDKVSWAIVFGSAAYDGVPDEVLRERLEPAIELYRSGKVEKILCSGDHLERYYDEPTAMENYLIDHGVSPDAILKDPMGLSTYDSLWRAKQVYGIEKATLCTQRYHLHRALFLAEGLGIEAQGCVARTPASQDLRVYPREFLALYKAIWNRYIRQPSAIVSRFVPYDYDERDEIYHQLSDNFARDGYLPAEQID